MLVIDNLLTMHKHVPKTCKNSVKTMAKILGLTFSVMLLSANELSQRGRVMSSARHKPTLLNKIAMPAPRLKADISAPLRNPSRSH